MAKIYSNFQQFIDGMTLRNMLNLKYDACITVFIITIKFLIQQLYRCRRHKHYNFSSKWVF